MYVFVFNLMTVKTILGKRKKEFIPQLLELNITNFTRHAELLIGRDNTFIKVTGHEADNHGSIPDKGINCLCYYQQTGQDTQSAVHQRHLVPRSRSNPALLFPQPAMTQ